MYSLLGGELMATPKDIQDARTRANYASRLGTPAILSSLIDALDLKDKAAFITACKTKLNTQNTQYSQAELDTFFDDLWKDSKASQRTQNKPCW